MTRYIAGILLIMAVAIALNLPSKVIHAPLIDGLPECEAR
jgi:hypothetical protein